MKNWLVLVIALILTGCGFHLKGMTALDKPMPYHIWQIEGGTMQRALEVVLRRQPNVTIDANQPDVVVKVLSASQNISTSVVDLSGNTNEYLLTLDVNVQAFRKGKPLGEPIQVTVRRFMDYSDHEVLAKENEQRTVWNDIRTDAAEQIIRRLAYLPVTAENE